MKALSDPNQVRIVKMLQHRSMCVCKLLAYEGAPKPKVLEILKLLPRPPVAKNVDSPHEWSLPPW